MSGMSEYVRFSACRDRLQIQRPSHTQRVHISYVRKIDQMSECHMLNTYLILIVVIVNEAIVGVEIVFGRKHADSTPIPHSRSTDLFQ